MSVIRFAVVGEPASQGSKSPFFTKSGRLVLVDSSKGLDGWRAAVGLAAGEVWRGRPLIDGPVMVNVDYWMPRPSKARSGDVVLWRDITPDLDKLNRATGDGLVLGGRTGERMLGGGILRNDSQIVATQGVKRAVARRGDPTGAVIEIVPLAEIQAAGFDIDLSWRIVKRTAPLVFDTSSAFFRNRRTERQA